VDPDQHIEHAEPEIADDLDALDRVDVGMHVAHPQARPCRYSVSASAIFLVKVVTSTRWPRNAVSRHSAIRSSTWFSVGRMMQGGSTSPVGRTICSTKTPPARSISQRPGVAETNSVWPRIVSHSSNLSGRLSVQEGRRKPYSARQVLRVQSPPNMPPSCGTVTWLSSTMTSASRDINSKNVGGGWPGRRPVR